MPSFFRFAIQTLTQRHSEVWSFYGNSKQGCLYANRASMSGWLKISFHGSGFCHIKARNSPDTEEEREHAWRAPEAEGTKPAHLMRMIYDLSRQRASLPRDDRVKVAFEAWGGIGSVHLNVYAGPVGEVMALPECSTTIGDFSLGTSRRQCQSPYRGWLFTGIPGKSLTKPLHD